MYEVTTMAEDEKKEFSDTINKMLGLDGPKAVDYTKLTMLELANTYSSIERLWSGGSKKRGSSRGSSNSPMEGLMSMDTVSNFVEGLTESQSKFVEEAIEKRKNALGSFPLLERGVQMFQDRKKNLNGGQNDQTEKKDK
jgi:hypothetical protein